MATRKKVADSPRQEIIDKVDSMDIDDRKKSIIKKEISKQSNSTKNNQTVNKGSIAYMARPNVKEFNKILRSKIFKIGKPYAFDKMEDLEKELSDYFDTCTQYNIIPTVTNVALWLGVDRDTIYAHANNSASPYSDMMKNLLTYLHDQMQSGTLSGDINPVTYIFLSKNYYGMTDSKDINVKASANGGSSVNSQETAEALRKQIEEENTPNANVVVED